ncbi:MAG: 3-phosphoshikimate 1-carboxyvinyltransferase [Actinomyces sp.]|uniref:3-phosphoshikimate 1-carboxyvinyltransferase n=1 Tax=Actinomyces sp. TaxID=29317 RepID=UPI0026DACBDC|nr:3-phosphoshikimate 1-carboxyvinyltransferase [Actinomyces sp.]MDO4242307.1 3-phosphoshikimate 1-carboxyvinyltransferase [Actinomyces sp.]
MTHRPVTPRVGAEPDPWPAPTPAGPLDATVDLPGSKSLTARALLLAALAEAPTRLSGVLRSRDTDLMIRALTTLGARVTRRDGAGTSLEVTPAPLPLPVDTGPDGLGHVDCGLAGTVMRFVPPLAFLADAPVVVDGDEAARRRPLRPVLEAVETLGAEVIWLGEPGHLPVQVGPGLAAALPSPTDPPAGSTGPGGPAHRDAVPRRVEVDSSSSSQILSALLLLGPLVPGGLAVTTTGPVPSLPHVAMTVACLRERGVVVEEPSTRAPGTGRPHAPTPRTWTVHPGRPAGGQVAIEPDLSNAGPFLAAALVAGGEVRVPHWPAATTQAGDAWRGLLPRLGGAVTGRTEADGTLTLLARGEGTLRGLDADLSEVGELVPTVAAVAVLASAQGHASRLRGVAHLRGHETDRLAALVTEINRVGGRARQTEDGLVIEALTGGAALHPARMRTYADHRMATFAAVLGLALPGTSIEDVATTSKTLPDFPAMWTALVSGAGRHA